MKQKSNTGKTQSKLRLIDKKTKHTNTRHQASYDKGIKIFQKNIVFSPLTFWMFGEDIYICIRI